MFMLSSGLIKNIIQLSFYSTNIHLLRKMLSKVSYCTHDETTILEAWVPVGKLLELETRR